MDELINQSELPKKRFNWIIVLIIAVIALPILFLLSIPIIRGFIVQPFVVSGSSMSPDYNNGDYLFVNELKYHFNAPQRGDVIIFDYPDPVCSSYIQQNPILKDFKQGPCKYYLKRIIGLPGETVKIDNGLVVIINKTHPNGFVLNEKYIQPNTPTLGDLTVTLGKNEYFVLGDNRLPDAKLGFEGLGSTG